MDAKIGRLWAIGRTVLGAIVTFAIALAMFAAGPVSTADADEVESQGIVVQSDIPYVAPWSSRQTQKLDLYTVAQSEANSSESRPAIVFIHGGSWVHGDKSMSERMPLVSIFLKKGYVVASINYRLTHEAPWPAQINDCKSAVRFLRANANKYGIDRDRIAVFGESAGAHLAMMMDVTSGNEFVDANDGNGVVSSNVQAVISDFGISDVSEWGQKASDDSSSAAYAKDLLLGQGYTRDQALAASPISYVNAKAAPILLVHGKDDHIVSYSQTVLMEQKLRAAGAKTVLSWYPDYGPHSSVDVFCKNIDAQIKYLDFLDTSMNSTDDSNKNEPVSVTRLYNTKNGVHLFSTDDNKASVLNQQWTGWVSEGTPFSVRMKSFIGSQVVSQFHNLSTGDYVYTADPSEIVSLRNSSLVFEGEFYVPIADGIPVFRLYNPNGGQHMLVTTQKEKNDLTSQGWSDEGIAFHAYPSA